MMTPKIILDGQTYTRNNRKWVNSDYMVMHEVLQDKLNKLYCETIDLSTLKLSDIISEGDAFKSSASYELAIKFYAYAIDRSDRRGVAYILPRLTSCYRKQGRAKDVIQLASMIKHQYGEKVFTPVLLTSIAAAYCDLEEYDNARKCCDKAFENSGGKVDGELLLVNKRIREKTK